MRVVTIDGPAGAGKSTVSRIVADRLGWRFLDTGAMYRAVALAALRRRIDLNDEPAIGALAEELTITLPPGSVRLDGEDVTHAIRDPDVTRATGPVADHPRVRKCLVRWQRLFAEDHDTVTEGRDQGTIVFPGAFRKFFLTASIEERARRRQAEMNAARGQDVPLEVILTEIRERDARDAARAIAPLRPANDALTIDTTGLGLDAVAGRVLAEVREAMGGATS